MNIQDIFYHGIRDQVRRVLGAMTDQEIDRGLSAFETGASSWSHCFFARALPQLALDHGDAERKLVKHLQCGTVIPVRIVYCTFDGSGVTMKKDELRDFIKSIRQGNDDCLTVLKSINYEGAADKEITVGAACEPKDAWGTDNDVDA